MTTTRFLRVLLLCPVFMLIMQHSWGQNKTITGKVIDEKGSPVSGASVIVKGSSIGTSTDVLGAFKLSAPPSAERLLISYVGYTTQEVIIPSSNEVAVSLKPEASALTDVVVVGYGTVRKKDLTGAVTSVKEKDFNKGLITAPDQLIQGKVAGVQVLNNSGQPGGATTVKIRGNSSIRAGSQPLYVVDGVPLDGRSARPGGSGAGIGTSPDANPLNFINPNDIASIDVLKDASATAIYGSRAAYGVVLITTKRGQSGATKLDVSSSVGTSSILKRLDVLDAAQYRSALSQYGLPTTNDYGGNVNALDAILQNGMTQNYSMAIGGGNENGRYRLSAGYFDQNGIIKKSDLKKMTANLSGNFKFLDNKKLGLDFNLTTTQTREDIPPVSNDAGFTGNIVGQALQWNPTRPLKIGDSLNILRGSTTVNPLAMSEAYDDVAKITTVLASVSPYYKFNKNLEYRMLASVNYSTGIRRSSIASFINLTDIVDRGTAYYANNELTTYQITHTLNYNKQITSALNLTALLGYEYMKFENKGISASAKDFGAYPLDYTNYFQYSTQTTRGLGSFQDPTTELQSYFARAVLNYKDRYIVTGTFRADGSTKFGKNNRYGYFPSFAAAWNISNEAFFKNISFINSLKLRGGWGKTGSQDVPAGSSQFKYSFTGIGATGLVNYPNPDLKWQADEQANIGLDFAVLKGRIFGSVDYFNKKTTGLLYPTITAAPPPPGAPPTWKNLDATIENKGFEFSLNATIIKAKDFTWDFAVNASFIDNMVSGLSGPIATGSLSGQGISGATAELITSGQPINVFYVKKFLGLDKDGQSTYQDDGYTRYFVGNPNPKTILGISTSANYKKLFLSINMNGAFGQDIYNNTLNSVIPIGNLIGGRNIGASLLGGPVQEALSNAISPSSRYLEKGNYLKLANATISYNVGSLGKVIKGMNIFVTGQNLLVITKFTGFDPEVNTDKQVGGVPSVGIEYTPYPSARSFQLGVNFSL